MNLDNVAACSDGTPKNTCVVGNQPKYCNNQLTIVNQCGKPADCGCPQGFCSFNGKCFSLSLGDED